MELGVIRPRFRLCIAGAVSDRIAQLALAAHQPDHRCNARVLGHHVDLTVLPEDRHRWSPCVHLEFTSGTDAEADRTDAAMTTGCDGSITRPSDGKPIDNLTSERVGHEAITATTVIHGLVGPHPATWTFFAFLNTTFAMVVALGLIIAAAQLTLQRGPWGLGLGAAGVILLIATYVAAQIGRRLAEEQTKQLVHFVYEAMGVQERFD